MSLKDEDELLANQREEFRKSHPKISHSVETSSGESYKPLPIAKDSGYVHNKVNANPSPQVGGGNSGGAIAAGVVSVLIVILVVTGFTYMITRTRLIPRLRAQITNKPYEDIIINDRGQAVPASSVASAAGRQSDTNPSAVA